MRRLRRASPRVRLVAIIVILLGFWAVANAVYQTVRKPTELFFPVSGALAKTPAETWKSYGSLFVEHSTAVIPPALLAALAQVEGSGNPVARTYWRWRPASNPFEVYRPASSAVGMYQITDATFDEAKRYCIHDHVVVEDRPSLDSSSCWFNALYSRVIPSNAIEMTSALLDRQVGSVLARHRIAAATPQRQQDLAAVIHLCGPGGGEAYAVRGFRSGGQRCGDHDIGDYLARVNRMKRLFSILAAHAG
jgi:transglycosylase-like protein with SLT domain